jgi:hypothetical protein
MAPPYSTDPVEEFTELETEAQELEQKAEQVAKNIHKIKFHETVNALIKNVDTNEVTRV